MGNLYLFRDAYDLNSATINRFFAFVKGFSELGINLNVVFIRPNEKYNKVMLNIKNVTFNYLWNSKKISNGKFKYFQQIYWILSFLIKLKKGDKVILFGTGEFLFIFSLFNKKINLYHEINEHPDVGRNKTSVILNYFHKLYLKKCKSLDGLFVISTSLKKYFIDIGVPEDKIHIINMIVDSSRFEPLEKSIVCENYIAYCGSIVNRKDGVDVLIKAFNLVAKKIPDIKLFLIGGFPFKEDEIVNKNLVKEYLLQDRVIFKGIISSDEMPQMLKNAKTLVLARPNNLQAKNGFPTKLGEYLLTAKPVVITDVGDISSFLKNEESAYIAEPDNINDIADMICSAVLNIEKSKIIGENGFNVAMQNFNYRTEAKKISNVIYN